MKMMDLADSTSCNGETDCDKSDNISRGSAYPEDVESMRQREFPALKDAVYLDHAGTTLYPKSMIESYTTDLTSNVFGNPHSASASSLLTSRRIEDVRFQVLQFLNADPKHFDVVFLANATAAIKLVGEACRDYANGFWYGYHCDSHTSLVGLRELANQGSTCFVDDDAVEAWMQNLGHQDESQNQLALFAYPGQSNMTGRRLPVNWCSRIRDRALATRRSIYSLFDAAALATTSPLDFSDSQDAPDFTALSFYKIFGFPDLGALIVRKASGDILRGRKYFAGGTVDVVSACNDSSWHMKKETLHSALEDGTLPFHSIIALEHAMRTHTRLYGSMRNVAHHTATLCANLYDRMRRIKHQNNEPVCRLYGREPSATSLYGPTVAFNILDRFGKCISNSEVEKLSIIKNIQFRTGGLCNPGGIANHLGLETDDLKSNYAAGQRCGGENDIMNGKPTGVIRVSLGAMSSLTDIDKFIAFLEEFYISHADDAKHDTSSSASRNAHFCIESMSIFPIKSCSAFAIPPQINWSVSPRGLAWDREWCLVHQGTHAALSQKQHPRMALFKPIIDIERRIMSVTFCDENRASKIRIGLDDYPSAVESLKTCQHFQQTQSLICGQSIPVHMYTQPEVSQFFSEALGVPCTLARYFYLDTDARLAKLRRPKSKHSSSLGKRSLPPSIKLSNESPILLVSRSSVNRLNHQIRQHRAVPQNISAESFRANIIISENNMHKDIESPYAEDTWQSLKIGSKDLASAFDVLGPCQRCQMVCIDQASAKRRPEPFSTLAKTRRWDGGVWFGIHLCLSDLGGGEQTTLCVGDVVIPS